MLLVPSLQHYAWGDPRFIPELLGFEPTSRPCAEAWFGAHPERPDDILQPASVLPGWLRPWPLSRETGGLDAVVSRAMLERFGPQDRRVRRAVFANRNVRWVDGSGREHDAEGPLRSRLWWVREALEVVLNRDRGFGPLETIDYLDGIRMRFEGGDIAHVCPSGNAPQLRILFRG